MTETQNFQPMTVNLDKTAIEKFQNTVATISRQVEAFEITSSDDYDQSAILLQKIVNDKANIIEGFKDVTQQAFRLHKTIVAMRDGIIAPLLREEDILQSRRAEWRRLQEKARVALEDEKRKIAKADADARALEEAKILQDTGEPEAAEIVVQQAALAPPPTVVVPSSVPKQSGISIRKVWKCRIVKTEQIKKEFLIPNESMINSIVSKLGKDAERIVGGIECYQEEVEAVRKSR